MEGAGDSAVHGTYDDKETEAETEETESRNKKDGGRGRVLPYLGSGPSVLGFWLATALASARMRCATARAPPPPSSNACKDSAHAPVPVVMGKP